MQDEAATHTVTVFLICSVTDGEDKDPQQTSEDNAQAEPAQIDDLLKVRGQLSCI